MTMNKKYQIMVPSVNTDGTPTIIHWSEPSLQSFKENVQASSWTPEFIARDPHCRVYSPKVGNWVDAYLSELLNNYIYEESI